MGNPNVDFFIDKIWKFGLVSHSADDKLTLRGK